MSKQYRQTKLLYPSILMVNGKADTLPMDVKTYKKHRQASNLLKLLAPAELELRLKQTQSMRSFLANFKRLNHE